MTILNDIASYKRDEVAAAKLRLPHPAVEKLAGAMDVPRGFLDALERARTAQRVGLIAEIKKASPSKGLIRGDFDPASLAQSYEKGGATCLSVLTDTPSFQGAPLHLGQARTATKLPVLRKDFMLDPYQVTEARAWGADCILIIMALVDDCTADALYTAASGWKMDALFEVHDEIELDRAVALKARIIGINNRDLNTFVTDIGVTLRLAPKVPTGTLIVAESGLSASDELNRLADVGVTTFLIGESLMRQADVAAATARLIGVRIRP